MRSQRADGTARPRNQIGAPRQQRHHVLTVEVAVGEREQAQHRPPEHALGEGADGGAVVRDARGGELLVHQAGVGLGRAVEHRHPFERHAVDERRHHQPDRGAHLVVGVGGRDDLGAVRRLDGRVGCGVDAEPSARATPPIPASARSTPVTPATTVSGGVLGHRAQQRGAGQRQVLRQVEHERAEIGEDRAAVADHGDGGVHQVASSYHSPASALRTARCTRTTSAARLLAREPVERGVVALRQLAVRVDERLLRRGMLGDRAEHARRSREHAAHRGTEDGSGHRAAPRRGEAGARRASPPRGRR